MTRERAEQIRAAIHGAHGWDPEAGTYTEAERAEITRKWNTMSGETTFYDAVSRLALGETAPPAATAAELHQGARVLSPGGPGTVAYVRMAGPSYTEPAAVSVIRDDKAEENPFYTGTIYPAAHLSPEVTP